MGKVIQVLPYLQVLVQSKEVCQISNVLLRAFRLLRHIHARNYCAPHRRREQARSHADGRRFTCAIRTNQPKDLSQRHGERQVIHRDQVVVFLAQLHQLNH